MQSVPMPACELELPYPPVEVQRSDPAFASLLVADYAGKRSELTAVLQYSYQHMVLKKAHPALSETLACISLTEMRHLDMLGELLLLLGDSPRYIACSRCRRQPWCGDFPDYAADAASILQTDMRSEADAIESYRARIRQTSDPNIRALLQRILLDEERHLAIFAWHFDRLKQP